MPEFIQWNSQPLDSWARKHAQGKFIDLNGRQTHYIEKGQGDPVILLHGFLYDSYLWEANIEALAKHFKVYALDFWGWGYSTRADLDYDYQLYVSQVLGFMDSLDIPCASLVGQSMGSGTAMLFCVQHRTRVKKLLLVAAAGLPNRMPLMGRIFNLPGVGEFLLDWNTDAVRKAGLKDYFIYNKQLVTKNYFENVTRPHKISKSTDVYLAILRKQFFDTLSPEIHQLGDMEVPILLVWGREDKAVPLRLGQEMRSILRGARLEVLDQAGHVPNFECAEKFNQLAIDFLRNQ